MLRLHARNPIVLTAAAAVIVVTAFAVTAPRFVAHQPNDIMTTVGVPERVMAGPKSPPWLPGPKLKVNVPQGVASSEQAHASFAQPLIAKTASLELLVTSVDGVAGDISDLARESHGDVFALDAHNSDSGPGSQDATLTIRIPAIDFERVMGRLSSLGKVRSRSIKADDLTSDITDSSARLRNLKRTESDILKIMDRSGNVSQIMDVENQLSSVREQIETLQADVQTMRGRVAYSTIDVHLEAEAKNAPAEPNALTQLRNAFAAAVHALSDTTVAILSACIWFLVFIPYLVGAFVVIWLLRLTWRRYAR